jgi:triosephosphate isomerase
LVKDWKNISFAYEPVWAIRTGKTASPEQAEEVHGEIRIFLEETVGKDISQSTLIIYCGSVNENNCEALIKPSNIDGFLVGGASLLPEFKSIVEYTKRKIIKLSPLKVKVYSKLT